VRPFEAREGFGELCSDVDDTNNGRHQEGKEGHERNVAAERHVAALVAEAPVSTVDAVVEDPGAVLIEAPECGGGAIANPCGWRHPHLAHLRVGNRRSARGGGHDQGQRDCLPGASLPFRSPAANRPEAGGSTFSMAGEGVFPHRSRFPVEGRQSRQGIPRAEKPA
jgi:hypothetical protein